MSLLSVGITSGVCIAIGLFMGYQVDKYFMISPWGVSLGTLAGLGAGMMETYKQIKKGFEKVDRDRHLK